MRTNRFYKKEGTWFIDLKFWPLSKSYLAMVCGADKLLDKLSEGKDEVTIQYSKRGIIGFDGILQRDYILDGDYMFGAIYDLKYMNIDGYSCDGNKKNNIWLCPVTLFIFFTYPKEIFFKVKK